MSNQHWQYEHPPAPSIEDTPKLSVTKRFLLGAGALAAGAMTYFLADATIHDINAAFTHDVVEASAFQGTVPSVAAIAEGIAALGAATGTFVMAQRSVRG